MRAFLIVLCILLAQITWAASYSSNQNIPPVTDETKGADKGKDNSQTKQTISIELPPTINKSVTGKLEKKAGDANSKGNEESVKWTDVLLALFTGLLVVVTAGLIAIGEMQRRQLKRTVDSAELASTAFLYPVIVQSATLISSPDGKPSLSYIFDNYGKSPAIIRSQCIELISGPLPARPHFDDRTTINKELVIVPPEVRYATEKDTAIMPRLAQMHDPVTAQEIELIKQSVASGKPPFHFFGEVVYDDFFGNRTTQWFCLRIMPVSPGRRPYVVDGGSAAYHRIKREMAPKEETEDIEKT